MSRRSSRLKAKPAIVFNELDADTLGEDDNDFTEDRLSDDEHEEPASKKRKTKTSSVSANFRTSKNTKGKRGKLRQLPEMPLDILYEIFGHLRPYDLLRLARTTKALRNILLRRSAKSVWKDALANIDGLPACPDDLNEPQFSSLAFDPFCHFCNGPNVHNVLWSFRVRACQKCIESEENFIDGHELFARIINEPQLAIQDISTTVTLFPCAEIRIRWTRFLYRPKDVDEISNQIIKVKSEGKFAAQAFLREMTDANKALRSHSDLCVEWQRGSSDQRLNELKVLKERRKASIWQRLRDTGWGDDLDKNNTYDLQPLMKHALVRKPQELTDRIWSNIKPTLIPILTDLREKRLERERVHTLKTRHVLAANVLKTYSLQRILTDIIPGIPDVCEMPPFKTVIWDTPIDVEVKEIAFQSAAEQLPQLVNQWRDDKDTELLHILDPSFELAKDRDQLDRATSQFHCLKCNHAIAYPRILNHRCMTAYGHNKYEGLDKTLDRIWNIISYQPWNFDKRLREARTKVRHVIACCLEEPDSATSEEMDRLDPRLECSHCSSVNRGGRLAMDWRSAVEHATLNHATQLWKLLDDVDTVKVKAIENARSPGGFLERPPKLLCTRCRNVVHSSEIASHMQRDHDVDNMTAEDHCVPPDDLVLKHPVRLPYPDRASTLE